MGAAVGERNAGTASPHQAGDPAPSRPRTADTRSFAAALTALRGGAAYSLCGLTLTVDGIAVALTGEEFDRVWELLDEVDDPEGAVLRAPSADTSESGCGGG